MQQKEKKIYISNLRPIGNSAGLQGRLYKHKLDDLWQTDNKGQEYINFNLWPNREPDQYGNTHAMTLNQWKPGDPTGNNNTNNLPF